MASKKRCDFCLKIRADSVHENDKILDRELRTLLIDGTGIEATPAQLSTILLCGDCAIGIAHASPIMQKARNLLLKCTTRRIAQKRRKNDDSSAGNTLLENGGNGDNSDVEHENNNTAPPPPATTPKTIVQRRKSTASAKNIINTPLGDEMTDSPVASSTLAHITEPKSEIKSTIKKTPIKKPIENKKVNEAENKETNSNIKLPKKVQQRRKSAVEKDGGGDKPTAKKQAKKTPYGKQQDVNDSGAAAKNVESLNSTSSASSLKGFVASPTKVLSASPAKALTASPTKASVASPAKSLNKDKLDSPSVKTASPFKTPVAASPLKRKLFAKCSDDEAQPTPPSPTQQMPDKKQRTESENYSSSQEDGSKASKICKICGKVFRHDERYLAHVESMKCSNAKFECKDLNCSRRFFSLEKMHEHIQRKHPSLMRKNESDDDDSD